MKLLSLHTDAFGARGGIALYNRDLLRALARDPRVNEVIALPRNVVGPVGEVPRKVVFQPDAAGSKGQFARAVARAAVTHRPDVVVCGHINLLPLASAAALAHRAKLVLMVYGVDVWEPHPSPWVRALLPSVDVVVSISAVTRDRMYAWSRLRRPSFVLPNAIDRSAYAVGPPDPELLQRYGLEGKRVLLTVGRLEASEKYKGIDQVLELLSSLQEEDPKIRYLVVGDGTDRQRLEEKARDLGHEHHVVFAGWVPEAEKSAHYRLADAYVMPGSGEGFGFVYLEALACGIPVVASRVDGSREAVRDGQLGEIVDPADPKDIRRGILAALSRSRGEVPEGLAYFDFDQFVVRCSTVLDELVPGASS